MSGDAPSLEQRRRAASVAAQWPADVDLDALYASERAEVDELVCSAADMSVWSLETRKDNALVYVHGKNSERLSYGVRAVTKVAGSVAGVLECLRCPDNASSRAFQKLLHPRNYLDGEVLHAHQVTPRQGAPTESMTLKWLVYSSPKTLGRSKEFCLREYCSLIPEHPQHGAVGVCKFESYDGAAARYGLRGKPDAYSLTVFEPSSFVVLQTPEDPGMVTVTLTFAMRKARGGESVSTGVRLTSLRLAGDLSGLQRTVQHALFAPAALAQRKQWVNDGARANCSLCVQSFGVLKRRHHCRVCGEVVCSSCTVFKLVNGEQDAPTKVRVCKACLAKSASGTGSNGAGSSSAMVSANGTELEVNASAGGLTGSSVCSTSSLTSDESHSPPGENPAASYVKGSGLSLNDFEATNPIAETPDVALSGQSASPPPSVLFYKQSSTMSDARGPSTVSVASSTGSSRATSRKKSSERRIHYFNEDLEEICLLAMETLTCPMAGIRTEDFELVRYYDGQPAPGLPRSLPTFRRLATRGKPCIVLDVSSDKRISGDKRFTAKLQFFVGIPLLVGGEVVGDLCVADRYARDSIDQQEVEVLNVLGETVTQYMQSLDYREDLEDFKASHPSRKPPTGHSSHTAHGHGHGQQEQTPVPSVAADQDVVAPSPGVKEVAF